jgi:AsmA family protein
MLTRRRKAALVAVLAVALAGTVLAAFLARDDWNWAKPAVRWIVARSTGRTLEIRGDLRVDLGWRTAISAQDVHFSNAPWAKSGEMLSADRLALRLRLAPLLLGRLRLERVEADAALLALEKGEAGADNWSFRRQTKTGGAAWFPAEIAIRSSDLTLVDPARPRGFALHAAAIDFRQLGPVRVIRGEGTYQEEPFRMQLAFLGAPGQDSSRTRTALRGRVGGTSVVADGWVGGDDPARFLEARLVASGASLDDLWRLVGFPLPQSPPFRFSGLLSYGQEQVRIESLDGRVGRSDIGGELAVALPPGERMRIEADVRSRRIDLDDIEGFWGRPPREEAKNEPPPAVGSASSVFPDLRFDLAKLRVADAGIRFAADRVQGKTVLDHVKLAASLRDGVLELHPLELGMSAGQLTTNAVLDSRGELPGLTAELVLRRVRLDELLARAGAPDGAGGELGGRAELHTQGRSLRELARNADGELGAVLQGGWISDPLLELLALHLGGYIRARLDKDNPGPIRCLVGIFEAKQGVLEARSLLLDTSHVRIEGEGKIDLAREELDLELEQHSKHLTFGALQTPIEIQGPLTSRTAHLKPGPLVARGGGAVALGTLLHPLAALLLLVDPGTDDKPGACGEALAEFRQIAPQVKADPAGSSAGPAKR